MYSHSGNNPYKKRSRSIPVRKIAVVSLLIIAILGAIYLMNSIFKKDVIGNSKNNKTSSSNQNKAAASSFNKNQYSINDPTSIWVIVNKGRVLPKTYIPADLVTPGIQLRLSGYTPEMHLRKDASSALEAMAGQAGIAGVHLMLASGYRSYNTQVAVYGSEVRSYGQAQADKESARPGHSEHQTGMAADLEPVSRNCELDQCFGQTPEGKWLAANAYNYGFIIRYPEGKDNITGYEHEPWHVRYVGTELALQIHNSRQTLEQFFGLPIVTTYPADSYQLSVGL